MIYVIFLYKRRKHIISLDQNSTIKSVLNKNFPYLNDVDNRSKVIIKSGDVSLDANKTFSEYDIIDDDCIEIIKTEDLYAGGCFPSFVDLSNERGITKLEYNPSAPRWRYCKQGLNFHGTCSNGNCEAFNKTVIFPAGLGEFDFRGRYTEIKCPICHEWIEPTSCGFCSCSYTFRGIQKIGKQLKIIDQGPFRIAEEENYTYFNESISGSVEWVELFIITKE